MGILDRIRDGPVQDNGDWDELTAQEYRNEIYPEYDVDVTVERFYGPPTGGGMKMDEVAETSLPGREAIEVAEDYIEDDAFADLGMDDVMTEFELRGRGDDDILTVEGGYSFIGHQNMYRVRFEF